MDGTLVRRKLVGARPTHPHDALLFDVLIGRNKRERPGIKTPKV